MLPGFLLSMCVRHAQAPRHAKNPTGGTPGRSACNHFIVIVLERQAIYTIGFAQLRLHFPIDAATAGNVAQHRGARGIEPKAPEATEEQPSAPSTDDEAGAGASQDAAEPESPAESEEEGAAPREQQPLQ